MVDCARRQVSETDEIRLGFIREIFADAGFTGIELENRARLFYYYEMNDPMVFDRKSAGLEDRLVDLRHRLLTRPAQEPHKRG